jgi:hypothetical protein
LHCPRLPNADFNEVPRCISHGRLVAPIGENLIQKHHDRRQLAIGFRAGSDHPSVARRNRGHVLLSLVPPPPLFFGYARLYRPQTNSRSFGECGSKLGKLVGLHVGLSQHCHGAVDQAIFWHMSYCSFG